MAEVSKGTGLVQLLPLGSFKVFPLVVCCWQKQLLVTKVSAMDQPRSVFEEWNRTVSSAGTRTHKTRNSRYYFLTYLLTDFTELGTDDVVRGHCSALFCNSMQAENTKWWTRETVCRKGR
jgi:hypothetical protein